MSWNTPNYALPGLMPEGSPVSEISMSKPTPLIFLDQYAAGDYWEGIVGLGPILFGSETPTSPVVSARMLFTWEDYSVPTVTLTTDTDEPEGVIIIDDEDSWEMHIDPVTPEVFKLTPGLWNWSFETTDSIGTTRTLYKGVLEVTEYRALQ